MTTITLPRFDQAEDTEVSRGFGTLKTDIGNLPLRQLHYHSHVVGLALSTTIKQTFYNPFDECIEATYVFPVEGDQAIVGCQIWVDDRLVRADLKERSEARSDYQRAMRNGHRAALLEQNRGETFSMRVGNIPPGEAIQVRIETIGNLSVVHGEWTLRLPLVVAPRYTSGFPLPSPSIGTGVAADTDQVPDASAVTPPTWLPGFPSPVDLSIDVEIELGDFASGPDWPEQLKSSLHAIAVQSEHGTKRLSTPTRIQIKPGEKVDRDFVLRGSMDITKLNASLMHDKKSQTFALQIVPPINTSINPRDVVFLLDRSGSMSGWKLDAARRGISRLVDSLSPQDRFQVLAFDNRIESPPKESSTRLQAATDANRYQAVRWLAKVEARGGTEMGWAIEQALQPFVDSSSEPETGARSAAIVLVTDGQITGEDSVLRLLGQIPANQRPRIYCLGVDRTVNGGVIKRITKFTDGTYELIESEKRLDEVLQRFGQEMGSPSITDLQIEAFEGDLSQLAPGGQSVLYGGRPVTFYGRSKSDSALRIKVCGVRADGEMWNQVLDSTDIATPKNEPSVLHALWGRSRLRELEDAFAAQPTHDKVLQNAIVRCSLETGVLSRFTAFIAVDETRRVNLGSSPHSVNQPAETPEGWVTHRPSPIQHDYLFAFPKPEPVNRPIARANRPSSTNRHTVPLPKRFENLIVQKGIVSLDQIRDAESLANSTGTDVGNALVRLQYATSEEVAQVTAESYKLPYVDLRQTAIPMEVIELIPESVARENQVLPLSETAGALTILMSNPSDLETIEKLRFILNRKIQTMVASPEAIMGGINLYYGQVEGESADSMLQEFTDTAIDFTETEDDPAGDLGYESLGSTDHVVTEQFPTEDDRVCMFQAGDVDAPPAAASRSVFDGGTSTRGTRNRAMKRAHAPNPANNAPVVRLVNFLIAESIQMRATHVLLTPSRDSILVQYVIEGIAVEREKIPRRMLSAIVARLKILSHLDISNKDQLQSGNLKITVGTTEVSSQVHFAPSPEGTTILMELGSEATVDASIEDCATDASLPECVRDWWKSIASEPTPG